MIDEANQNIAEASATPQFMRRMEAAAYLNGLGLPVAVNTLMKLASVGGGPTFRRFGRIPVYTRSDLDGWARSRLSGPMASTSDTVAANGIDGERCNDVSAPAARAPYDVNLSF